MKKPDLEPLKKQILLDGMVIPAHPLALDQNRRLDERYQKALTRYYMHAGAGGIAVGVHTTQFEIREFNLLKPVLSLAAETVYHSGKSLIMIAGIIGKTEQAVKEAELAVSLGYDMGLLSMGGLNDWSEDELIERARVVSEIIPLFGFYLQPSVGGRLLPFEFWKKMTEIDNLYAIKIAPFNRYQTLDVVRAVCESDRRDSIALYTGNDDNMVADLLTTYCFDVPGKMVTKSFSGGLLGHWAFWTKKAVELLNEVKKARATGIYENLLTLGAKITDVNAAVFDPQNDFRGCLTGINEILRRQGLLPTNLCLKKSEKLSQGQLAEIDRVCRSYPELNDDLFVKKNLPNWLI